MLCPAASDDVAPRPPLPRAGLFTRLRRSWSLFSSGREMMDLLRDQSEELKSRYDALASARGRMEREIAAASLREQRRIADALDEQLGRHLEDVAQRGERLAGALAADDPEQANRAALVARSLRAATLLARDLASGLDPLRSGPAGLPRALRRLAEKTAELCAISCEFHQLGDECVLDPVAALSLYRITQEALNNAVRHGGASRVRVLLSCAEDIISLTVTDNGKGMPPSLPHGEGMGLRVMEFRARSCGGVLRIDPAPEGGTSIASVIDTAAA